MEGAFTRRCEESLIKGGIGKIQVPIAKTSFEKEGYSPP